MSLDSDGAESGFPSSNGTCEKRARDQLGRTSESLALRLHSLAALASAAAQSDSESGPTAQEGLG
jgi:hypothetical protein